MNRIYSVGLKNSAAQLPKVVSLQSSSTVSTMLLLHICASHYLAIMVGLPKHNK